MNPIPEKLKRTFLDNNRFLLVTHTRPDGDAIGSVTALGKGLKSIGKLVDYCVEKPIEERLAFLGETRCFNETIRDVYDVIVYLDCSTENHAKTPEKMPEYKVKAVIDHHKSNLGYGDVNFIEITSATGELVYRIMKALDITLDEEMIDAVFTAISTDTGSFQFANVTPETHQILSQLYELKDNFAPLSKRLHSEKTFAQMKLYGKAVESMRLYADNTLAWITLSYGDISKYGGALNITDDIANIGMNTIGVQLSATLKEVENNIYRVSLRSKSPFNIDVATIAEGYGGGGHMRAAGFTYTGNTDELRRHLIRVIEESREQEI